MHPTTQTALITGASRGIGRAIALELAQQGIQVALVARSLPDLQKTADLIAQNGGTALPITADVTDQQAVFSLLQTISTQFGPVSILINNAGSHRAIGPIWEIDPDLWWSDIETNLRSIFLCSRAVLPTMLAQKYGYIINISSNAGNEPRPYSSAYSSSKAAVTRFTESLMLSLQDTGICTFALHPGSVRTEMADHLINSPVGQRWVPEFRTIYAETQVPASQVAHLITRLISGEANALSGTLISVYDNLDTLIEQAHHINTNKLYRLRLHKS